MTYFEIPRTILYEEKDDLDRFLGSSSEKSIEREFYDRLIRRPFVSAAKDSHACILKVFNNACYIYLLMELDEMEWTLSFNNYIEIAAEGTEDPELNKHIAAATMALLHSWLGWEVQKLKEGGDKPEDYPQKSMQDMIYQYYLKGEGSQSKEIQGDFFALIIKDDAFVKVSSLKVNREDYCMRDIIDVEKSMVIPIQDVARGIDFVLEVYSSSFDSNRECESFLNHIFERFEDERALLSDTKMSEKAKLKIKKEILRLRTTPENSFSLPLSLDNILSSEEIEARWGKKEPEIDLTQFDGHLGWIIDKRKAKEILKILFQYMDGKYKPQEVLMPLCAALEAGVIRKPKPRDYDYVFSNHLLRSPSSLRTLVTKEQAREYRRKSPKPFGDLVELFRNI